MDPTNNENLTIGFVNVRWRDGARSLQVKDTSIYLETHQDSDDAYVHIS